MTAAFGVFGYVGIDLAWGERARTGLALLDHDGRLVRSTSVRTDEEISDFLGVRDPGHRLVVAIDAPLVVPNETGQRPCEREVGARFARFHAGAYPANRANPAFRPQPRGARLADAFGWDMDPGATAGAGRSVAIEVYPHPAMIVLFGLDRVLPYKSRRGRDPGTRRLAFASLLGHLERVCGPRLDLSGNARWRDLRRVVEGATRQVDLERIEDEIDAILCAYVAWMWVNERDRMEVLGDFRHGYIVVPRQRP